MSKDTPRIGFWMAVIAGVFGLLFSIVALMINFTTLIPELWANPAAFLPSLLLAWSYLVLMTCVVELAPQHARIWSRLGVGFATIYTTINTIVYFTQLTVVSPALFAGQGQSVAVLLFTPHSFMQSANGLAYGLMSAAALLASQSFARLSEARFVRWSMVAHGAIAPFIVGALFWPDLVAIGALWMVTFPVMTVALALQFRRAAHPRATRTASHFEETTARL